MLVSVIMSTYNHAHLLENTLESIFSQRHSFGLEIVITDDGSSDNTREILTRYSGNNIHYFYLNTQKPGNGVVAKNNSIRESHGDVLVMQSDDVVHASPFLLDKLVNALQPEEMCFASVQDWSVDSGIVNPKQHVGITNKIPLFFLGACWRKNVCQIGGYDEKDFADCLWYHDTWLSDCMMQYLGVKANYLPLLGLHQDHSRPWTTTHDFEADRLIYERKYQEAAKNPEKYISYGGAWPYESGYSVNELLVEGP